MSGGTLGGLSGSGVAIAKSTKPTTTNTGKPNTSKTTAESESEKLTVTGAPGAQKQTTGGEFSEKIKADMAAAAANPYTAPAATTPTQQGMDPAMMAMMSGMGGQKSQAAEQGGSRTGSQGSQAEQALQEMAQRFNNFRKEAGERIAELTKGNKESPGDKVVAQALEKLTGKQAEPEAKTKDDKKQVPETPGTKTTDISDYGENAFSA